MKQRKLTHVKFKKYFHNLNFCDAHSIGAFKFMIQIENGQSRFDNEKVEMRKERIKYI